MLPAKADGSAHHACAPGLSGRFTKTLRTQFRARRWRVPCRCRITLSPSFSAAYSGIESLQRLRGGVDRLVEYSTVVRVGDGKHTEGPSVHVGR